MLIVLTILTIIFVSLTVYTFLRSIEPIVWIFMACTILVVIVDLTVFPTYLGQYIGCSSKAKMLGYEFKYGLFEGCFMKDESGWFEYGQQRILKIKGVNHEH